LNLLGTHSKSEVKMSIQSRIASLLLVPLSLSLSVAAAAGAQTAAPAPSPSPAPPATAKPRVPRPIPGVPATEHAVPVGESGFHRIGLPGAADKPFPYTVEVPAGWTVREIKDSPGLWLGPVTAQPPKDPHLVYIRISLVDLGDPEKVAANIRASDAKNDAWVAPRVEVRDLQGVKGVLVRMDSGAGDAAHSTLALKLPMEKGGVDFMASAAKADFEKMLPIYERILLSVRRAAS
jgi:hypothetical protein